MFDLKESKLAGCFELQPRVFTDSRGSFIKTFHGPTFTKLGLETNFREAFYSTSHKDVVRGLHFQIPPYDHAKLVTCSHGVALDVVVDLRVESKTYGQYLTFELSSMRGNSIYVPRGMAHGFCALTENVTVLYSVSTEHHAAADRGIRWDSIGFKWPVENPIISERDSHFPTLQEFTSPFRGPEWTP